MRENRKFRDIKTIHSRTLAESAALRRVLNTYLRETGETDPRMAPDDPMRTDLPEHWMQEVRRWGAPMRVNLPVTGKVILGAVIHVSPFGHHDYGNRFWISSTSGSALQPASGCDDVIRLLLDELAAREPDPDAARARADALWRQIGNSVEKTALYIRRRGDFSLWKERGSREWTRLAEQSLLFGHPFHPTPKSSEGFAAGDLERYAPELGASFPLHYFAVDPERILEACITNPGESPIPPGVRKAAEERLGAAGSSRLLLPCHPWQAEYLRNQPGVRSMEKSRELIYLGPLGDPVYPTSSVRTVCDPNHGVTFKLPLNIRITHFVRVNPREHLRRSLDASLAVRQRCSSRDEGFRVLLESGYRTIRPKTPEEETLVESFSVLFREHPFTGGEESPVVVAALLEERVAGEPAVIEALREAGGEKGPTLSGALVERWLRHYLDISLRPLLKVFIRDGISLEAHVQNAMLHLENGWPRRFYVRDMEGVSISRERARELDFFDGSIPEDSPVLYPDEEAWKRFKYYVVTNHLGHLIHTVAYHGNRDELELWGVVRRALEDWSDLRTLRGEVLIRDLLENPVLPAKANLISRFQERGEQPLYVTVTNPICEVSR